MHKYSARAAIVLLLVTLCLNVSCVKRPPEPPVDLTPTPVAYMYHTVKFPGETLSIIADWYTGNSRNWEVIVNENPGLDPKRIRIGDVIIIPRSLVVKDAPLPEKAVRGTRRERPVTVTPEPAATERIEQPEPSQEPYVEDEPATEPPAIEATPEEVQPVEQPAVATEAPPTAAPAPTSVPTQVAQPPTSIPEQAAPTAVPTSDKRIKSREELLRELLAE